MKRLEGKVAFITGVARGQGRAHAVRLASEGANIIGVDICAPFETVKVKPATLDDLAETAALVEAQGQQAVLRQADVRDMDALQAAFDEGFAKFGRIDVVVANAGVLTVDWSWEMSEEKWQETIGINLTGVWHATKAAIPAMIKQGQGGSIILTSSTAGLYGQPFTIGYTASKHGVVGIGRALAAELSEHNIRVNTIHPTGVKTEMVNIPELTDMIATRAETLGPVFMNGLPVEYLEPEDIANVVAFLASDESKYTTGSQVRIDAGKLNR